ncbi:hypothetical protein A2229_05550 [Candidatus Peregrinibacteria bacterium RIFOXYA2_FULL_33_7]|nr:MAG: ATP/ADP translocase-like protein [Candidatus Peregrinibacteria bacterium GW2011_GWC2_33_13]OGJ48834.1 MAG: hypothetical protein A2229_05550 [Candidatus Peregrinibacteria bacterium RIFOXYA2_FULL_33_7]
MIHSALTYINRILNTSTHEWPRIGISWSLSFCFKISMIIGWTILLSSFVSRMGVKYLPYLFVLHAVFTILGTILYSELVYIFKKEKLLIATAALIAFSLFGAFIFAHYNDLFFFTFLLIGGSLLLSQMGILISIFNEELYTPLESERTFPIIESAETIAGLSAGILITLLSHYLHPRDFISIWIGFTLLVIPLIFIFINYHKNLPKIELIESKNTLKPVGIKNFRKNFQIIKKIPFLKGLLIVIILQWFFINLFEFQYTKAINASIIEDHSKKVAYEKSIEQKNISNNTHKLTRVQKPPDLEQELTKKLGSMHIIFSGFALIVQLFVASRLIRNLGIIGSMIINPLVMLFASIALTFRYNFFTAVIAKTGFEISNVIFKNPYHSSFYALSSKYRKQAKEFLEGIGKPIGAIFGTLIIILFQQLYLQKNLTFAINITLISVCILLISHLLLIQKKYTKMSTIPLWEKSDEQSKLTALEILSQKGHFGRTKVLINTLNDPKTNREIRIKTLEVLGIIKNTTSIPDILNCLQDEDVMIRKAALESLEEFENLDSYVNKNAFTLYLITSTLKNLFDKETNEDNLSLIIKILSNFNNTNTVEFIINKLKTSKSDNIKVSCISACAQFKDPNCTYYVLPYLNSPNLYIRVKTIIALWQFPKYKNLLQKEIDQLLKNQNIKKDPLLYIELISGLNLEKKFKYIYHFLYSDNIEIKIKAAIALTKSDSNKAYEILANRILENNPEINYNINNAIKDLPEKSQKEFRNILNQKASLYLNKIFKKIKNKKLESLDKNTLMKLLNIYKVTDSYEEYYQVMEKINLEKTNV